INKESTEAIPKKRQQNYLAEWLFNSPNCETENADSKVNITTSSDSIGRLGDFIACLWHIPETDGRVGALRAAGRLLKSEDGVSFNEKIGGLWFLVGLVRWQRKSRNESKTSVKDVLLYYKLYLQQEIDNLNEKSKLDSKSRAKKNAKDGLL